MTTRRSRARVHGDVEQPALLGQQLARDVGGDQPVGADPVGLEQRGPAAEVGPAALLDARDDDEPPLQALGAVRGQQPHGVAAHAALGQRVGRDLLGVELARNVESAGVAAGAPRPGRPRRTARRRRRGRGARAAPRRRRARPRRQPRGPGGAGPQRPEQLLGGAAGVERARGRAEQLGRPRAGPAASRVVVERVEHAGSQHGCAQELGGGRGSRSSARPRGASRARSCAGQRAHVGGVQPAERAGEQRLGPRGVDVVGAVGSSSSRCSTAAQRVEQRRAPPARATSGELVAGDLHRDAGGAERAAQRRDRRPAGAHQHGHLGPGRCRPRGAPGAAGRRCARPRPRSVSKVQHLDPAVAAAGVGASGARNASRAALGGCRRGSRCRPATRCDGGQQPRPEAAGGPQRHDLGRRAVGAREVVGKSRMPRTSAPRNA